MYFYQRNLKDLEYALAKVDDWIVDLKDQTAEVDDIENYVKELYEIMYEFESIGDNLKKMRDYIDQANEVQV